MIRIIGYFSEFARRLRMLLHSEQFDRELREEMRLHLELKEYQLLDTGLPPQQVHSMAMRQMGNDLLWREESHEIWGWNWLEDLIADARYGLRQFRKNLGFTVVGVSTLALGIGANTAIFTLLYAVMLKPLPVVDPQELYSLGNDHLYSDTTDIQTGFTLYSYGLYQYLKENTPEFSELAALQPKPTADPWIARRSGTSSVAKPSFGQFVSGNYFSMFGIGAFVGRTLAPSDDQPGAVPVAVMNCGTWKEQYGSDPSVVGSTFTINGTRVKVVGVAACGFFGDTLRQRPTDFWVPLTMEPILNQNNSLLNQPGEYWLYSIGRLKHEAQPVEVEAQLNQEIRRWLAGQPGLSDERRQQIARVHMALTPASSGITELWSYYAPGFRPLIVISAVILLITCTNIANLLVARSMASRLQTVVCVGLGATRTRLVRQMLVEGLLLATLGGIAGLAVSYAMTRTMLALVFRGAVSVPINPVPSPPVLVFASLLTLLIGVMFSTAPAWSASNARPAEVLRGAGDATSNHSALLQKLLVAVQAGLSLVLLVVAGLLTRSLRNLEFQNFGFETQNRLIVRLNPALAGYTLERLPALYQQLEQRLAELPGVLSVSLALNCPEAGFLWGAKPIRVEGRPLAKNPADEVGYYDVVSNHYFETIGTRLLHGRAIDERDMPTSRYVAVVNQSFARKFFPNEDPIGKRFGQTDGHGGDFEIVGIVEDAKYRYPEAPADPMFFRPLLQVERFENSDDQRYETWAHYIDSVQLHVTGPSDSLVAQVQRSLANIDPNLTVIGVTTPGEKIENVLTKQRLMARLTALYGLLALILASVGLYGVAACAVVRRKTEIGIRLAIGANRTNVTARVLWEALAPIAMGLGLGIPVALAAGNAIASQLYGVGGHDPRSVVLPILALSAAALIPAIVPAVTAACKDPMKILRRE